MPQCHKLRSQLWHLKMPRLAEAAKLLVIFFATFGAVFLAEIVGDKLLYTTGVLAARYRTAPIMIGMAAAFMVKKGVDVLVGESVFEIARCCGRWGQPHGVMGDA